MTRLPLRQMARVPARRLPNCLLAVAFALLLAAACSEAPSGSGYSLADGGNLADGAAFGDGVGAQDGTFAADGDLPDGVLPDGTSPGDGAAQCQDGEVACHNDTIAKACIDGTWLLKAKCKEGEVCNQGSCAPPTSCTPNESGGCDGYTTELVCAADGKAWLKQKCPGKQQCAAGKCRDVVCTPGITECDGAVGIKTCLDDGSAFGPATACKPGSQCFGNKCVSLCEQGIKFNSNVGCEYWLTDLDNEPDQFSAALNPEGLTPEMIPHSVIVANPGQFDAEITFTLKSECSNGNQCAPKTTCGGKNTVCGTATQPYQLQLADPIVKAGGSKEFKMPVLNVDGSGIFPKGVQLKSTQPVVAFMFNPFNAEGAASNDGSLLLPYNSLGKQYFGVAPMSTPQVSLPGLPAPPISQHGYITVLAVQPGETTVDVTPTCKVIANGKAGVPQDGTSPAELAAGKTYTFKLQQFDVLNLESKGEISFSGGQDLTGTKVVASKPVAFFAGHEEAVFGYEGGPEDSCCAEHIEEQLMPVEAWGTSALCVKTKPRGPEKDIWIVMAGQDNVTLKTTPPIGGLDGKTLGKAGQYVKVETEQSFVVEGTGKIQVVQYIVSRDQTDDFTGDPTMMVLPPVQQLRDNYVIQTADGFGTNWTSVVRPKGATIKVDGAVIASSEFAAFGDGTWERAYHKVDKGTHLFEGDAAFGLMVYGYGNATAYGYPGGMNLK